MKRTEDLYTAERPVGGYIGDLLESNPMAINGALQEITDEYKPIDKRPIDNPELVRRFTQWAAEQYPEGKDPTVRRWTAWKGIHLAYTIGLRVDRELYTPSLREAPKAVVVPDTRNFDRIVQDSFECADNYPVYMAAATAAEDYLDPWQEYPLTAQLGTLAGFTMIHYNDAKKKLWLDAFYKDLEATREVLRLEERWSA